jgi:hypothetical protein
VTHEQRELETIQRLKEWQEFRSREKETVRRLQEYCDGHGEKPEAEATKTSAPKMSRRPKRMLVLDLDRVVDPNLTLEGALNTVINTH